MRNSILILIAVFLLMLNMALSDIIDGKVIDQDGIPIEGVNVQTNVSSVSTITDDNGEFVLDYKNELPSYLTFSHVSYQPIMLKMADYRKGLKIIMSLAVYPGQKIRVTAMRAQTGLTPVAFSDVTDEDIERDYTMSDFPQLLEMTPNMYSFSYSGGAIGATEYKIRGFDSKRIGVYINGIPLNDPEDQITYFYDLPDFAAEVSDIQVQRGVGNSFYGDATFGGSINISTAGLNRAKKLAITAGYGEYYAGKNMVSEMRKQSVEYSSGLINGRWLVAGRYSTMYSGGYRKHSWYDGYAYFVSLSRLDPKMTTTINFYGGPMKAHLAFYGVDRGTMKSDRRFNWSTYENEIDDFNQPHIELHNHYRLNDNITLHNTFYYIRGKGYYEGYKWGKDNYEYNIPDSLLIDVDIDETNLIRQKWVAKNQYGWNPRFDIGHNNGELKIGGSFYLFDSEHWGEVIWGENLNLASDYRYYEFTGKKTSASFYIVENYSFTEKINLLANIQLQYLQYDFDMPQNGVYVGHKYSLDWLFFSPRIGMTYQLNDQTSMFFNFAVSSSEPSDAMIYDADYPYAVPALDDDGELLAGAERVYDFELGSNYKGSNCRIGLNLYWMEFRNEIIQAVGLDDDYKPLLTNADRSVHSGIELDGNWHINKYVGITGNASYSFNRLKDYVVESDLNWDGEIDQTDDFSGNTIAGFPEYICNFILDFKNEPFSRFVLRARAVGKQYIDNGNSEDFSIDPYTTVSLSTKILLKKFESLGTLSLTARIDNLFNKLYELTGVVDEGWAYYIPAAERNFYLQLKWELE